MKDKLKIKQDYSNAIKELTDKQAGELIKGLCAYVYDEKPFITKDGYLKGIFMYIKRDLDISKQNSLNGKKGAEKKRKAQSVGGLGILLGSLALNADDALKAEKK